MRVCTFQQPLFFQGEGDGGSRGSPPLSVLFDILYKNKIRGNSLSAFLKLNFIAPVVLICTRSEVFTNSISDSDYWEIFIIYMYTRIVKAL